LSPKVLLKMQSPLKQLSDNRNNEISWVLESEQEAKNFLFLLRSALKQIEGEYQGPYKGIYGVTKCVNKTVTFVPKKKFNAVFNAPNSVTQVLEVRTFSDLFVKALPETYSILEFPYLQLKEGEKELLQAWMKLHNVILEADLPYRFKKHSS
jgi:hypothetical protein